MRLKNANSIILAGMLIFLMGVPSVSMAQSNRELSNRLNRLENEVQTLNHAMYRGGGSGASLNDPASQANFEVRLQQMETEIRSLRGQIEEQNYEIRKLKQKVDRMGSVPAAPKPSAVRSDSSVSSEGDANSFYFSSGNTEAKNAAPKNNLGTLSNTGDDAAALYENAFALLKAANYDRAEKEFSAFLEQYPKHILASNAKYWLGETYYVRGIFDKAARNFAEGFQLHPNGAKAADNLLKLGMSLASLGKKDDACVALGQLDKEDYKNAGPVLRRAEQERKRLSCP